MELEKQNILFIVRTMGLGGTENVVLQLCEILSGKVNKIVVCSSGGVHEKKLQEMGIKHYLIPDIASKNPMDMLKSCRSIKRIIRNRLPLSTPIIGWLLSMLNLLHQRVS